MSVQHCKKCQKPHHTLLHVESNKGESEKDSSPPTVSSVISNAAAGLKSNCLLMTCHILIDTPNGSSVESRATLDSASSASFISERISQSLAMPPTISPKCQNFRCCHNSPLQAMAHFTISPTPTKKFEVIAVVVPRVTCDLPLHPVPFDLKWNHFPLADPDFGCPGRIDLLIGVELFVEVLRQGWRSGTLNGVRLGYRWSD